MVTNRRETLAQFLRDNPDNAFARYGLAMELKAAGENEAALAEFARLVEGHPGYVAAHQQAGQLLSALGRNEEAKAAFDRGIAAARAAGDAHALREIQGLRDELG